MVRSIAIAAGAAYLTMFVAEGSNAPEIPHQGVSSIPSQGDGVSNTEQQPSQQSPTETASTEARPSSPVGLLTSLLRLASSVIAATRSRKQAVGDSQVSDGINRTGEPSFGESSRDSADVVEAALKANVILPPARGPGVLGKEEVETRIRYMDKVLQFIEECEKSGRNVDSTGQSLGHRLRLAYDCVRYYDRPEFDNSVTFLQLTDFLSTLDQVKDAIKRHGGTDESPDEAAKVVDAALRANVVLPPARDRGVLGPKGVATRIQWMQKVLQYIKECEESGHNVDSTGQTLGHRLRLVGYTREYYGNPKFDDNVDPQQVLKYKDLLRETVDVLKRHFN